LAKGAGGRTRPQVLSTTPISTRTSPRRPGGTLARVTTAFLGATAALALLFYLFPAFRFGRGIVAYFMPLSLLGIFAWRFACLHVWGGEGMRDRVLILGASSAAKTSRARPCAGPPGVRGGGLVAERGGRGRRPRAPVLGALDELQAIVKKEKIDWIVVALEDFRGHLPVTTLMRCRLEGIRVEEAATFFEHLTGKILIRDLRPSWFVFSQGFQKPGFVGKTKRLGELLVAGLALVVLAPLLALPPCCQAGQPGAGVLSPGAGAGKGRPFGLAAATMRTDAEEGTDPVWAQRQRLASPVWAGSALAA
jgi:hypothetical protein